MSLEASFAEYDLTDSEISINDGAHHAIAITDIKHTVKKGINQMVALATKSKMSDNTISKLVPVIDGIPGVSIEIPKFKQTRQKFVHKLMEPRYFAKCEKCGELNDCSSKCSKCNYIVEKKSENFFVYLPVEEQITNFNRTFRRYNSIFESTARESFC